MRKKSFREKKKTEISPGSVKKVAATTAFSFLHENGGLFLSDSLSRQKNTFSQVPYNYHIYSNYELLLFQ